MVAVATPILRHRLILNFTAQSEGITVDDVIAAREGGARVAVDSARSRRRHSRGAASSTLSLPTIRVTLARTRTSMPLPEPDVLARAEALGLKARSIVEGLRVGDHKSPYRGFSVEFVQHREYVPGDDIRHIDWKSYGRSERYTIKQYEQETNFIGHMLLDASNSMLYGDGATPTSSNTPSCWPRRWRTWSSTSATRVSLSVFDAGWRVRLPAVQPDRAHADDPAHARRGRAARQDDHRPAARRPGRPGPAPRAGVPDLRLLRRRASRC